MLVFQSWQRELFVIEVFRLARQLALLDNSVEACLFRLECSALLEEDYFASCNLWTKKENFDTTFSMDKTSLKKSQEMGIAGMET